MRPAPPVSSVSSARAVWGRARSGPALFTALAVLTLLAVAAAPERAAAQYPIPVNIESTPPGATVYLDSTASPPIGVTPLRNVRIVRGQHTLIFRMEGHEDGQLPVNIRRRRETFTLALSALGTVAINAGNDAANGATVRIDGETIGPVPYRGYIQPGRHLVQVGREGHVTFSQWIEVAGGQVLTLPVLLEEDQPDVGTILVAVDVTGAPVYLDGEPRGVTPTVIENVPVGEHTLEIRPDGLDVWRQRVRVLAGERLDVSPELRPVANAGSLRVLTNVPGAMIRLDGEVIGESPATAENVSPGEHILDAQAPGYLEVQQPVVVESGQQRVVSLRLEADQAASGRIVVRTDARNAVVTVDGQERGTAPVVVDGAPAGIHTIIVDAEGYEQFRRTCETGPSRNCEITAAMTPIGTPVHVEANAPGAELYVDGELVGPVPYEGNLPAGQHELEVRAQGYQPSIRVVNLTASEEPRRFNVALAVEGAMSEEQRERLEEQRRQAATAAASHAAAPLPENQAVLDMSLGWIHLLELRLGVGLTDWLDGGFAARTFFRYTEFELRGKVGFRPLDLISVGAQLRLGGGFGPAQDLSDGSGPARNEQEICAGADPPEVCMDDPTHDTNSFFFSAEALGSIHFSEQGAFTLWMAFDFHTDGYDFRGDNSDLLATSDVLPAGTGCNDVRSSDVEDEQVACSREGRQSLARFRIGGALDLTLSRSWSMFVIIEGIVGPKRDLLGSLFGFGPEDTQFYARLGFTHKF